MLPVLPLTLAAGLIYGFWGIPLVLISATLAAFVAFVLARGLLCARISHRMRDKTLLRAIQYAVSQEEWKIVILLRLSPVLSFAMQNYLLAITDVRLRPYVVGSAIGMMPAIGIYVYLGSLGALHDGGSVRWELLVPGIAAALAMVLLISRRAKQALLQIQKDGQGI